MLLSYKTVERACKVIDANGLEWQFIRSVDTETGEAEQLVVGSDGRPQIDWSGMKLRTQMVRLAAPVVIVPLDDEHA